MAHHTSHRGLLVLSAGTLPYPTKLHTEIDRGGSMEFLADLWGFLRLRKKYWLLPIILVLLLLGALIVFTSGSALAPFVYTLF